MSVALPAPMQAADALKAAGFDEAKVRAIMSAGTIAQGDLVTKADLKGATADLRGEITDLKGEITEVRGEISEVRGEISEVRGEISEVRGEMIAIEARLDGRITALDGKITALGGKIYNAVIMATFGGAVIASALFGAIKWAG